MTSATSFRSVLYEALRMTGNCRLTLQLDECLLHPVVYCRSPDVVQAVGHQPWSPPPRRSAVLSRRRTSLLIGGTIRYRLRQHDLVLFKLLSTFPVFTMTNIEHLLHLNIDFSLHQRLELEIRVAIFHRRRVETSTSESPRRSPSSIQDPVCFRRRSRPHSARRRPASTVRR